MPDSAPWIPTSILSLTAVAALLAVACAPGQIEYQTGAQAKRTPNGLFLTENPIGVGGDVYVRPGVDLQHYDKVMLDRVLIRYKPGQQVPAGEQQELLKVFQEEFEKQLRESSVYAYVTSPGPDVLRVTAHAVDFSLQQAPDPEEEPLAGATGTTSFSADQGWMTIMLDVSDAESNQALMLAAERREITNPGGGGNMDSETATVSNSRFLFNHFALLLRQWLDSVRDIPPLPASLEKQAEGAAGK